MKNVVDYQIIQRDENGIGYAPLSGIVPESFMDNKGVFARVAREDDNYSIVDWTECDVDGNAWNVTLCIPQGGLYRIEVVAFTKDSHSKDWSKIIKMIHHVGVGDVYVIAGQSNMAGYGKDVANDPPTLGVHLYANDGNWKIAAHPLNDDYNSIYPENMENCLAGTSPALSFARNLKNRIGVPVGLVQSAKGGSPIVDWHPNFTPVLYNALLRRLEIVGKVKGVIWYQGCSETMLDRAVTYFEDFKTMVECWRRDIGYLHFLTVQINRWTNPTDIDRDTPWGIVKEAQRRAGSEIEGVSVITAHDMNLSDGIHNNSASNLILGERLCNAALNDIYGIPAPTAPNIISAKAINDSQLIVAFNKSEVVPMDEFAEGIILSDSEGNAHSTRAEEVGDGTVRLTFERKFTLPATLSAYCNCTPPAYLIKERNGMPILAFKDFKIEG